MTIGRRGEELAAAYLKRQGYAILARNVHIGHDELDIIAEDGQYIVFAEVKTRAQTAVSRRYGRPALAVDHAKQQNLLRAVSEYLRLHRPVKRPRIDVIEVYMPAVHAETPIDFSTLLPLEIRHLRNAVHK